MKVEIDVAVKVGGASVEEALARVTEKLMVISPTEFERERYAKEFHQWEEENGSDMDWYPVSIIKHTKDGKVSSSMEFRIRSV